MAERTNFLGCEIRTQKSFRPRIETEFWAGKAIGENRQRKGNLKILDLFAGSGCIGISFLKRVGNSSVDFADISPEALSETEKNLKENGILSERYRIVESDLFSGLKGKKYDVILSNPPYVAEARIKEVEDDVLKRDPAISLFGGKDGTDEIKRFLSEVGDHLKGKGVFYMEFDPLQEKAVKEALQNAKIGYQIEKDQFGKVRWLKGRLGNN